MHSLYAALCYVIKQNMYLTYTCAYVWSKISLYLEIFSSEVAAQELVMTRQNDDREGNQELVMTRQNDDREGNQELQNPVKAYEQLLFSVRSTFTCIKVANH